MTVSERFHHAPITSPREIRILYLHAGAGDDPLTGRLEHVELESDAIYEALSYEWGSQERSDQMLVDFKDQLCQLNVTASLAAALRDLRHQDKAEGDRLVWADGICINQSDKRERQHQVFLMGSIYRKAWRVITYIGQSNGDTQGAISLMDQLWRAGTAAQTGELRLIGFPERHDPRCVELRKMILSGWAGRAWCAQEFLLNQELIFLRGRCEIEWFQIPSIIQLVFNQDLPADLLPYRDEDPLALQESLVSLWRMRRSMLRDPTKQKITLFDLLKSTHSMMASDPRDKIYALLALASDSETLSITVDYDCSVENLYISVAAKLVERGQSIKLLDRNLGVKRLGLPSWVPDWSCWRYGTVGMIRHRVGDRASGHKPSCVRVNPDNSLILSGCVLDTIACLSDPVGPHFTSWDNRHQLVHHNAANCRDMNGGDMCGNLVDNWFQRWIRLAVEYCPYPNGCSPKQLLWYTLTYGEDPTYDSYARCFDAYTSICHGFTLDEDCNIRQPGSGVWQDQNMAEFVFVTARRRMRYRRLCGSSERGFFAAVPEESLVGDKLCIIEGAKTWFVLRSSARRENVFELIGPAYVHGFMNGEVLDQWYYKPSKITLI